MYNVYLDGILQSEEDIININQSFEVGIVREDGFTNTEQILREKSNATMQVTGAAFRYICTQRRLSLCTKILCTITYDISTNETYTIFEGYISQENIDIFIHKGIAEITALKDNSFSGLFVDYINTEITLSANRTRNCTQLTTVERTIEMYDDPANMASTVDVTAFDVFDVLNYLVQYFTDDRVYVVSDYLTGVTNNGVRHAITLGYNLHNTGGATDDVYPVVSFSTVFNEIRKKTRLYMIVEYDANNDPYLRIEPESYSYDSTSTVLNIPDVQVSTVESINYDRFFNSISVGSTTTSLQSGSPDYPQSAYIAWNNEVYASCSNCSADKDSEGVNLDLVSDFIIDSNIIYEALQELAGSDYANNDNIFMFEYEINAIDNSANAIITVEATKNIYNDGYRNENVINEWLGYTPLCISLTNGTLNYFLAKRNFDQIGTGTFPDADFEFALRFDEEIFDTAGNYLYPFNGLGTPASQFIAPTTGSYQFEIGLNIYISSLDCLDPNQNSTYQLVINVYDSGNNLLTSYYSAEESHPNYSENIPLQFITPEIPLNATEYVIPLIKVVQSSNCGSPGATFDMTDGYFELYSDVSGCNVAESNEEPNPFILEFDYPLCHEDYIQIKNNKRGTIIVNGYEYFIKELQYKPRKVSRFKLIGKESMCNECTI